ncbi:hypothetical protein CC1G_14784 [Coprinopsis cinerea okayama7|uniref:Uncharacterized protein n=1 Tax=Coprinopsis cinerea (strain Okayama-7 / 130 / ATCC MYA-4618 / FGSC 9003) TaxID=240176 RepID=D6RNU4_COPC7|nr:hypothetical protein CC1G_14784 [Coprinopsis cinerea okayama7\|eukprot:XP_002910806.1 hypothetical protein CC1G_14784 [Coprinopsis cinerea okayama7\
MEDLEDSESNVVINLIDVPEPLPRLPFSTSSPALSGKFSTGNGVGAYNACNEKDCQQSPDSEAAVVGR